MYIQLCIPRAYVQCPAKNKSSVKFLASKVCQFELFHRFLSIFFKVVSLNSSQVSVLCLEPRAFIPRRKVCWW